MRYSVTGIGILKSKLRRDEVYVNGKIGGMQVTLSLHYECCTYILYSKLIKSR